MFRNGKYSVLERLEEIKHNLTEEAAFRVGLERSEKIARELKETYLAPVEIWKHIGYRLNVLI